MPRRPSKLAITMTDFIETYENAIPRDYCESLIARFEQSDKKQRGATGMGVDLDRKDSLDINISHHAEWAEVHQYIIDATFARLVSYMRKFAFLLSGALVLSIPDPDTGEPMAITPDVLDRLSDRSVELLIRHVYRLGTINMQKYARGIGGYPHWHSENYPKANDPHCEALHRTLLFMYYLNDVEQGGETEFFYQRRRLQPSSGQLVVAPSGFTHTHRGNVPLSSDKYILTSWVLFQPADRLFGG